jgi:hypothetical protein
LDILVAVAKASPRLANVLLDLDVMSTLYQLLTGQPPPPAKVVVSPSATAIAHMASRPADQLRSIFSLVSALLPPLPEGKLTPNTAPQVIYIIY